MGNFTTTKGAGARHAAWIADIHSISLRGIGARVDLAADFGGKTIPSGTAVKVVERAGIEYIVPADGTGTSYLTYNDVITETLSGSSDTVSLVTGGDVYENKLPATLSAAIKTSLGGRFGFQNAKF